MWKKKGEDKKDISIELTLKVTLWGFPLLPACLHLLLKNNIIQYQLHPK